MLRQTNQIISNFFTDKPEEIKAKTKSLIKKTIDLFTETGFNDVKILLGEAKSMRYSIQGYIESIEIEENTKNMLVQAGYNSAIIDAMQLYITEVNTQKEIQRIPTLYKDPLLQILKRDGTLLHKELAAELRVSNSELTDLIKRMNSTSIKLVNIEAVSKYKLYSLTPAANQYLTENKLDRPANERMAITKPKSPMPAKTDIHRLIAAEPADCIPFPGWKTSPVNANKKTGRGSIFCKRGSKTSFSKYGNIDFGSLSFSNKMNRHIKNY